MADDPSAREPESFSREYVAELRNEAKGHRLKADEQAQRARAAEAAAAQARAEAEAAVRRAEAAADERVIRAELRTAAFRAGMVDLDGLKLADLSGVTLNDRGEAEGAEAMMAELKAAKPYLFAEARAGTSNPLRPPTPKPNTARRASELSEEEYRANLRRIDFGHGLPK